jgi:hypothetical protein
VLLHLERAAALFAIVVGISSVLREAARGRLPTQLSTSGLGYGADDAAAEIYERARRDIDDLYERVLKLERIDLGSDERSM